MMMAEAAARANSNVALAKYWGKRDEILNLPYTGSISITLAGLTTTAAVAFGRRGGPDRILMNGSHANRAESHRIQIFLDIVRKRAGIVEPAEVEISTSFPVAAGLASSASTFAALALAAQRAAGLGLSESEVSALARRGSGSASRSILGGFVEWIPGEESNGSDSYAVQLAPPDHWKLGVIVAITSEDHKRVGSREGMSHAVKQSPFFPAWLSSHEADLDAVRDGLLRRDLDLVGRTAEHNCLKMHAVSMAATPALLYWTPATLAVIQRVLRLREEGTQAYFTIDAGPQVKIICPLDSRGAVADAIAAVPGVRRMLLSEPGAAAELVDVA
jgi:diphosphomevalonate decarboxylase